MGANYDLMTYLEKLFLKGGGMPVIFSTIEFWILLIVILSGLIFVNRHNTARIVYILVFNLFFYYKANGLLILMMLATSFIDFRLSGFMAVCSSKVKRRLMLSVSILMNIGLLVYFKYSGFLMTSVNDLFRTNFPIPDIVLPVGISFYTFQSVAYMVDVYKGKVNCARRWLDYLFFLTFFPILLAGPILRAGSFLPQLERKPSVSASMIWGGFWLLILGIVKKAVIADYIMQFNSWVFESPADYTGMEALLASIGYSAQIYCDFSGYSDMAIGIALLLGFEFPKNFDSPYKATSVTDFWHRWHISLSTWLRDYLYISLGGNRHGKIRTYINLMLTMILGGLWHGASWNFIVWGTLHGVALAVHKFSLSVRNLPKNYKPSGWRKYLNIILTFHFVCFCWLFFRNTSFENSMTMIESIFTNFHPELFVQLVTGYKEVFILILLGFASHFISDGFMDGMRRMFVKSPYVLSLVVLIIVVYIVIQVKSSDVQPFIYFQF